MSVVAVRVTDKEIVIGADSILVSGWTQEKDKLAKLNEVNGMIIGDVGDAQEGALFLIYCKTRKPREASSEALVEFMSEFQDWMSNKIEQTKLNNQYIIIIDKKAFMMEGFFIKEVTDYTAIGAGMDYALSALYLGNSVKESIKAACHLSIYCEEPINLMEIKK
jgi:ATP-dependent protease HslVU (ClpYQ) peptidase subunit|tara:strand:+ start:2405 stop:2896 length:492 start_codon:yes stop_codon:yes gene_type:complete